MTDNEFTTTCVLCLPEMRGEVARFHGKPPAVGTVIRKGARRYVVTAKPAFLKSDLSQLEFPVVQILRDEVVVDA